jgi:hypothetical protein
VETVPSAQGTLLVFVNGKDAWHGFTSYSGPRRAIQLNYEVLNLIPHDIAEKTLASLKIPKVASYKDVRY